MKLILDRYPPTYRSEVVSRLMSLFQRGESACIVGVAGVGKSNLAHFLEQPEVKEHYWSPAEAKRTHFVSIPCWPGNQPKDEILNAMLMWAWLIASRLNPQLGDAPPEVPSTLQMLRGVLRTVCYVENQRVVFVLDEFESLIQYQPAGFFDDLRALRDDHRATGEVLFLVMTHRLPQVVRGQHSFGQSKFFDIIRDHMYALTPYTEADADSMIDWMLKRTDGVQIEPQDRKRLIWFSGGHSGLLRVLFTELAPDFRATHPRLSRLVHNSERIRASCDHIWNHLHLEEQQALRDLIRHQPISADTERFLRRRGLLLHHAEPTIFSPLFREYVLQHRLGA